MAFSAPSGGVITQTGSDSDLSGLVGNGGVTVTSLDELSIYDLGTNRLRVDGTLTINGVSDAAREMLVLGVNGATQNVDIDIGPSGTLIVGSVDTQLGVEFNQEQFWPSIFEDAATDFGDGNGNISGDGGTSDAFLNVEGGGRFEWYGCINSTGGMRFKGVRDGSSGSESEIVIRGGVLDARRLTERGSGEADQFIYTYTDQLDIQSPNGDTVGFTILSATTIGGNEKGLAIIQLGQPIALSGYRPVFSSQAVGGSNSASIDLVYTITDYTGIIGSQGTDNIDLRSASIASNTSVITFLNSVRGSLLNLATQDPGFNEVVALQTVRGTIVDSAGANRADAVMGTQNKNNAVTFDDVTAGAFDLGNILLTSWNDDNPPTPTFNNPSDTNDDLWSFYVYSYLGLDRNRIDVRLRGVGGTDVDFIAPDDLNITEQIRTNVDAYIAINDLNRLYDRQKSHKVNNISEPALETPIAVAVGQTIDFGALDLIIDSTAVAAWDYNAATSPDTITINPSDAPQVQFIGATSNAILSEGQSIIATVPLASTDDDMLYLIVGHPEADSNTWTTPAGWSVSTAELLVGGAPTSIPGLTVYERQALSEPANYTVNGNFTSGAVAIMIGYRGVDTTNPQDATATTTASATGDPNPPSITTVNANSRVIAIGFADGQQVVNAVPSGYTSRQIVSTDLGGDDSGGAPVVNGPYIATANPNDWAADWIGTGPAGAGFTAGNTNGQWSWDSDETPSTGVGPLSGNNDAGYIYTEMTGQAQSDEWTLEFDQDIDASANSIQVDFFWVARGDSAQAVIRLQTNENGAGWITRETTGFGDETIVGTGAASAPWFEKNYDLAGVVSDPSTRIRLQIIATAGPDVSQFWHNDIGFDDCTVTITPLAGQGRGMTVAVADNLVPAAGAENPAAFDFDGDGPNGAITMALRLDDSGGGTNLLASTSKFDRIDTTGLVTVQNGAEINGLIFGGDVTLADVGDLSDVTIFGTLRLLTAGVYNFSNVIVGVDILNEDGSGNAEINGTNGSILSTSEPGTGNGEVNIIAAVNITLTDVIADSEVRLYQGTLANASAAIEIDGVESSATSVVLTHNNVGQPGYIVVHKENYVTKYFEFPSLSDTDTSIPAGQQFDPRYLNP